MIEYRPASPPAEALPQRDVKTSMLRGWSRTCPACGEGALYGKYLKVVHACPVCGEEMHHQRADDAPPYVTMVIVCHVIVGGVLLLEQTYAPPTSVHLALWLPLTVVMSLWLLPRIKGSLVGLQWALRMHGFGAAADEMKVAPETYSPPPER